ncbi:nuclear transport factor 2 family protein [Streptomyces sp. JV176]|uniref:hypothetical protein n=1 Tax=Streptomyces sp. JV176 TaxID=858630 RepID=UPI002E776791|nr:hypothetical protein [Streptomyces sp. JV176]MEE1801224.1 nuclear transport factor 2 family protein [Streptomyces sp. JV176]
MTHVFDLPAVLTELLYGDESAEPLERTLDKLITPDFVQRINGRVYRRAEYTAHVREMRQMVTGGGELQVLEQINTGSGIAGRFLFRMVPADGQALTFESHLFARIDGGRVARLIEVAHLIGDDHDEDFLATAPSE